MWEYLGINMTVPANNKIFVFDKIVKQAANEFNIPFEAIFTSRRQPEIMRARSLVCAWAADTFQRTPTEIALRLDVNLKTAYRLINKGRKLIYSNSDLKYKDTAH